MKNEQVARELLKMAKSLLGDDDSGREAGAYLEDTNWDKVRFAQPKQWVWQWKSGGWNGVYAKSKKEAIAKAKKEWAESSLYDQWIESSFRVPTEREYRSLNVD